MNAVSKRNGFTVEVTAGMGVPTFAQRTVALADGLLICRRRGLHRQSALRDRGGQCGVRGGGKSWQQIGAEICVHPDFPNQTNVEFVRIVSPTEIEIRIFERGVGPTTSSGTGSSASATAALAFNGCHSPLTVVAPGGAQTVPGTDPARS